MDGLPIMMDEGANLRARYSEIELELARAKDEVLRLKEQNRQFTSKIQSLTAAQQGMTSSSAGGGADGGAAGGVSAEEKYQLQKQIVTLTESKENSELEVTRLKQNIATMELNLNREIQKARDESERQAVFLRSQLLEAKEMQGVLQEKLVVQAGVAEALKHSEMDSFVTENILITSDAVLHRITSEKPLSSYKTKYDVVASISGRTLVLSGKKLNVHLLKAEILEALNDMYRTMTDPTKYVSSAKARDTARSAELDHLRRTISTYESTVASLHTALQQTQDKAHQLQTDKQKHDHEMLLLMEKVKGDTERREIQTIQLQKQVAAQQKALAEAESTNNLALDSLKAEAKVTAEFRAENALLKEAVQHAVDGKELAERAAYSAKEQSRATSFSYQEMIKQGNSVEAERRRAEMLDQRCTTLQEEIEALRKNSAITAENTSAERGKHQERLSVQSNEIATLKQELKDMTVALEQSKVELQAAHDLTAELRNRMNTGTILTATSQAAQAASERGEGAKSRLKALEQENMSLRKELQQAFDDLRAVAGAVKEGKSMREKALGEVQQLENERGKMLEERQNLEVELVRERMAAKTKQAEMLLQIAQAKEEADHQRKRAEMLHDEYQRRIQEVLSQQAADEAEAAARGSGKKSGKKKVGGDPSFSGDGVNNSNNNNNLSSLLEIPSYIPSGGIGDLTPNDASQLPAPTPQRGVAGSAKRGSVSPMPAAGGGSTTRLTSASWGLSPFAAQGGK